MMDLTQSLVQEIALEVFGSHRLEQEDVTLDVSGEWPRVTLQDALLERTGIDYLACADLAALQEAVREKGLDPGDAPTWGRLVDDLFSDHVEPHLIQPSFITHYPLELSPLAKRSPDDPRLVERFEGFIGGVEVANAFSELNDPDDQRKRLEASLRDHAAGDEEAHPMDEDYIAALEVGLPPSGGLGIGVDRLVMVLTGASNLREIITFPHMRERGDT
jgi:lysyl-tRNA synthetase class 2